MTTLFRSILDWVQSIIGNYGWSVIVFSLLIKCVLLPLDVKSRRSMRAMAALNPKLEELKKRYANDQEKLNQKMSELYKKNGVNPLSGCLPMLIQLPILYIMFAAMRHACASYQFEHLYAWISQYLCDAEGNLLQLDAVQGVLEQLRSGDGLKMFGDTQSWLWIKSVFQPDTFGKTVIPTLSELTTMLSQYPDELEAVKMDLLSLYAADTNGIASAVDAAISASCGYKSFYLFMSIGKITYPTNWSSYVNGYFILPVLAAVTQFLSTKLQPDAGNSTQSGSGKFMKWFFPIFSLWICLSSTAAFAIYWVFVNVWSIVTSFAINKYLDRKTNKPNNSTTQKEALQP